MKYCFFISALILMAALACKKSAAPVVSPQPNYGKVTIAHVDYRTVTIGKQTWTEQSYHYRYDPVDGPYGTSNGDYYFALGNRPDTLPTGWRVATVADFNKLTANFKYTTDFRGNNVAVAGGGIEKICGNFQWTTVEGTNALFFNGQPSGYVMRPQTADGGRRDPTSGYYLAAKYVGDRDFHNVLFYKLNPKYAGIVSVNDGTDSIATALMRFVKDN
ncbi:fibrobacter succinogenes major paralogous domain-containing protein [Mucilaginibacter ginsenosidivorax]|uniref:Fibrobacter succinogenes major paralogous domain-containing protein n=1 Tax=Mucilaginibacter ginsenosidivorax TaxID=862126 RepID=A0A5B8W8I1_9SPHI|nr:hypothetical protein [Mucilaginibacter ginsenosidivorax]QEC80001.1 hypothetical protein FSB76_30090 [Mucilaginibacter ginsenosidivorax]